MQDAPKPPSFRVAPLKRVLKLARPELRNLVLGTLFLALGSVMGLLFPQAIRMIVDDALAPGKSTALIDKAAAALLVIFFFQAVATSLRYILFTVSGERVVARLRADLFASLMSQEVAFFDERRTGELVNRLASGERA